MIDPCALGASYVSSCGMTFVVVDRHEVGVVALVLQDNQIFPKQMRAGTCFNIFRDTAYWEESVPFASVEKEVE